MTVTSENTYPITIVGTVANLGLNFRQLIALNNLSWLAHDKNLTFLEIKERFQAITRMPRFNPWVVLLAVALANASFCRLFGGDWISLLLVFAGTLAAQSFRHYLGKLRAAPSITFMLSAFVASIMVAIGTLFNITSTPQIAIGSSVLFLIPGVPMINSTLDLLTGFQLMAFSRLVHSGILVSCIGLGIGGTLFLTGLQTESITSAHIGNNLLLDIVLDGAFASIASMGFAMLSNPGKLVIFISGFLAALGHSFRFYLLHNMAVGIIPSSLFAALLIGLGCVIFAKCFHIPGEFFSFLALLPMIPGMYAYGVVLSTINFLNAESVLNATPFLISLSKNFLTALFILCSLAIGAIAPMLLQHIIINAKNRYS